MGMSSLALFELCKLIKIREESNEFRVLQPKSGFEAILPPWVRGFINHWIPPLKLHEDCATNTGKSQVNDQVGCEISTFIETKRILTYHIPLTARWHGWIRHHLCNGQARDSVDGLKVHAASLRNLHSGVGK